MAIQKPLPAARFAGVRPGCASTPLPRLLRALAQMAGQLTNLNQLAGQLLLDHKTAAKYVGVLEQLFLIRRIQPWGSNKLSRIVKSPKLHFLDSWLLSHLRGADADAFQRDRTAYGSLLG